MRILCICLLSFGCFTACSNNLRTAHHTPWQYAIGCEVWSPLSAQGKHIFFGCDDQRFYAFDTQLKAVTWQFNTQGIIRSGSVVWGNRIAFVSDDGYLYSVDIATGQLAWKTAIDSTLKPRRIPALEAPYTYDYRSSTPVVANNQLYVGSADGRVLALDAETGNIQWQFQTQGAVRADPLISGETLFASSWDGNLYALSVENGTQRWAFDTGGIIQGSPVYAAGKIVTGSRSTKIFAIDAASGKAVWEYKHPDDSWVDSSPIVHQQTVYFGSSDALSGFAFNIESGELLNKYFTGGWTWGKPVIVNDTLYLGAISAHPYYFQGVTLAQGFHGFNRHTGARISTNKSKPIQGYITGGFFAAPVVVNNQLVVGGLDGVIYGLPLNEPESH